MTIVIAHQAGDGLDSSESWGIIRRGSLNQLPTSRGSRINRNLNKLPQQFETNTFLKPEIETKL